MTQHIISLVILSLLPLSSPSLYLCVHHSVCVPLHVSPFLCVCVSQSLSLFPCLSVLLQYLCYYIFCYYTFTRSDTVIIYCNNNHLIIINWTTAVIHKSVCVCVHVVMFLFKLFLSLYMRRREGGERRRGRKRTQ